MISVIIPAKNEAKNLTKVLPALIYTFFNAGMDFEGILVDNGSVDETAIIAKQYGFKLLESPIGNVASLRNIGAQKSQGDLLLFLDADIILPENWIQCCLRILDSFQDILILGSPALVDFDNANWVEKSICSIMAGAPRPDRPIWIGTSNMLIKKSDFEGVGGFNEKLITGEDYDFCLRINTDKRRVYLNKACPVIHLGESKTLLSYFKKEYWRGKEGRLEGFTSLLKGHYNQFIVTYIFWGVGMVFSLCSGQLVLFGVFTALYLLMPVVYVFIKNKGSLSSRNVSQLYAVATVYLSARSFALSKRIMCRCFEMFKIFGQNKKETE